MVYVILLNCFCNLVYLNFRCLSVLGVSSVTCIIRYFTIKQSLQLKCIFLTVSILKTNTNIFDNFSCIHNIIQTTKYTSVQCPFRQHVFRGCEYYVRSKEKARSIPCGKTEIRTLDRCVKKKGGPYMWKRKPVAKKRRRLRVSQRPVAQTAERLPVSPRPKRRPSPSECHHTSGNVILSNPDPFL